MAFPTLFPTGAADSGNYFTHLLKYDDGRFARHPRFRFFALNTEMRSSIYIQQHPGDAQLTTWLEGKERLFPTEYSTMLSWHQCFRGTRQFWFRQCSRVISMVGLPTIFFTHSAADLQWPEPEPEDPDSSKSKIKAVNDNPALLAQPVSL